MQHLAFKELANEGERLCKLGDCKNGIKYFEEALKQFNTMTGSTNDQQTCVNIDEISDPKSLNILSIIYNQMGNAYFYLQDYTRALDCHKKDLALCEKLDDASGKAKSCGNIGNTLQLLGDYDEAILYSLRNLEISVQLGDSSGEARSLYNLGNIYQSKGKHMGRITYNRDISELSQCAADIPSEIKDTLNSAIHYYRKTLEIVGTKDRSAEGRTYGNLGNTYYLLGDFEAAISCHQERLKIAKEYGDKAAERRAYSNLGNSHVFMGKYNEAAEFYLRAMNTARLLGDKAVEAQSYFSLGNVYTLVQDYTIAIDFHLRHLQIALVLEDRIGECRAYWSLGNAYAALGDLENAIVYASRHLNLARQIGDTTSELTAKMNLYDFQNLLSNSDNKDNESALFTPIPKFYERSNFERLSTLLKKSNSIESIYKCSELSSSQPQLKASHVSTPNPHKALSTNNIDKAGLSSTHNKKSNILGAAENIAPYKMIDDDDDLSFLDTLSKIQSSRLDDQRCSIKMKPLNLPQQHTYTPHRVDTSEKLKESTNTEKSGKKTTADKLNDDFFKMLMKTQGSRLEDQRSSLKQNEARPPVAVTKHVSGPAAKNQASTIPPDDAFFSMLQKFQSRRLDGQRSSLKLSAIAASFKSATSSVVKSVTSGEKPLRN